MARRMTAKYPGTCRGCGEGIDPGDTICHAGKKKNYHARCFDGAAFDGPAKKAAATDEAPAPAASAPTFDGNYDAADDFAWGLGEAVFLGDAR